VPTQPSRLTSRCSGPSTAAAVCTTIEGHSGGAGPRKPYLVRAVMDVASRHLSTGLEALAQVEAKLRSFGYALYLETQANSWTPPRGLAFCGIGYPHSMPAVTLGFAIHRDATGDRAIIFSVLVAWDAAHWSIQSSVEEEDCTRDEIPRGLWESPQYSCATHDEFAVFLKRYVDALISSPQDKRVAAALATVTRRQ